MNVLKTIILFMVLNHQNSLKSITDMCKNEEDQFNLQLNFRKLHLKEIFTSSNVIGKGGFGQVYSVLYYSENQNQDPIEIAVKELNITDDNSKKDIEEEIAYLKEFSDLSSTKFVKYIDCFYIIEEKNILPKNILKKHQILNQNIFNQKKITKVYLMQEKLDDNLEKNNHAFQKLDISYRYLQYLQLLDDLRYFHNDFPEPLERKYLDGKKSYVHMDLKLNNIISKGSISSKNFTLKIIDFGSMNEEGTKVSRFGTPGYMHPSLITKKFIPIKPKMDIYSLFVSIAELEFGHQILSYKDWKDCRLFYSDECHENFLFKIYQLYCKKNGFKDFSVLVFQNQKKVAYDKYFDCIDIICIIFRELRWNIDDIDDLTTVINSLDFVYKSLNNKII